MQNLNIVLDVSAIIWDEADYNANEQEYYELVDGFTDFLTKIEKEKTRVLLSATLQDEMMANFPFGKPPYYNTIFEKQTLSFLSKVETVEFPLGILPNLKSYPELIKEYYNDTTKTEMGLLVSKIHSDVETKSKYFTFNYLWNGNDKLKTETKDKTNTYETIVVDNSSELDDFFKKIKPRFEHNPKHDCETHKTREAWNNRDSKKRFVSQLTCYKSKNDDLVQSILNKAIKHNSEYIGYDEENEIWIRFKPHREKANLYHGFDEYDDDNSELIPLDIKEKLHK